MGVKMQTVAQDAPRSGWAPKSSFERITSELDASTGRLTGNQQQVYADLPIEEWTGQPSCSSKLTVDDSGGVTYHRLQPVAGGWAHMSVYGV